MRVKKKTDKNKKNILGFIIFSLCTISILCVFYILFFISEKEGCLNKTVSNSRSQKYNLFQSQRYTFLPFTDSLNEYYSEMVNEKVRRYSSKLSDEIKNRVCESRQKKRENYWRLGGSVIYLEMNGLITFILQIRANGTTIFY